MGKSGAKLSEAKAEKVRKAIRAVIKDNKDLQAAVSAQKKAGAKSRSAISRVIVRNPLLQQAAKGIFNKMK